MNAQKFTQKALETINQAQNIAIENHNQAVTPEHLLYALLDADGGLIPSLMRRQGIDPEGLGAFDMTQYRQQQYDHPTLSLHRNNSNGSSPNNLPNAPAGSDPSI